MKSQESRDMEAQPEREAFLRPPVDICEDAQGITLKADLPGVSRDRLNIQVDKDTLAIDMPKAMEPMYADMRATRFRRTFTLSHELDTDKVSAQMNDGVLTLRIPKRAEVQPRKIQVTVG